MKINISLRVYAAYSRRLLYILYLIPCCTPDLQRAPTWKESANEIMERATLDRCHHFHGHSGMCAQLASWFELFCFSSLPGRVLISVPRGLCQKRKLLNPQYPREKRKKKKETAIPKLRG